MKLRRLRPVWVAMALVLVVLLAGAAIAVQRYRADIPQHFANPVQQFKYGSTGGDRLAGIPIGIFKALPRLCRDYLPGDGWESLGFIYEPGMDRPIGTSLRQTLGLERVSLNCATCHVGTYRLERDGPAVIVPGMPANRLDLVAFTRFLENCMLDERFNPWQVVQAAEATGARYGPVDRFLLRYVAVPALREAVVFARFRLRFLDYEVAGGPGRFDTFGPLKALLNWPQELLPARETTGIVDFPSLWLQGARAGMHLHWDGNNDSVEERNRSAGFGTGAVPPLADDASLAETASWLRSPGNVPPKWPLPIDQPLAARGAPIYARLCAGCHGASGRDFTGAQVGQVTPIEEIGTDPCRLDNYTAALAVEQGNLYAAYPDQRFRHFRKTHGYANAPLDGVWLRGPYLHNGSVPTVRDLLEPWERRPAAFWRGDDLIDPERLGFVTTEAEEHGRKLFRFETRCPEGSAQCAVAANPENRHEENTCAPGPWAGNSNRGHDGPRYGTDLPASDKDALVEFLKTF
ncbi:MAG: hypothetical protein BGO51_11175 [Rhodospirillales bacterium 69-11]|nr:hypothetical protein [Rhodospirillales bacterium]OJW29598.1 MAG: hypothetical protein BGO51_11175 [Rhodospirillales bacterium 69-11]